MAYIAILKLEEALLKSRRADSDAQINGATSIYCLELRLIEVKGIDVGDNFINNNLNHFSFVYRLIDLCIIQFSILLCVYLYDGRFIEGYNIIALVANCSFLLFAESLRIYRSWRTGFASRLALYTFVSWFFACFCVVLFIFFFKIAEDLSRIVVGMWLVLTVFLLVAWRMAFRAYLFHRRSQGYNCRRVAIFGMGELGERLAAQILSHPETGLRITAVYDDRSASRLNPEYASLLSGTIDQGVRAAKDNSFDVVYVALPLVAQKRLEGLLRSLGDSTLDVYLVPDFFTFNLVNSSLSHVGNLQTLSVYQSPLSGPMTAMKRLEDIVGSLLILSVICIPMLVIAAMIKLDSRGPVIFKQNRYGVDGRKIKVYKFRSMRVQDNGPVVKQATKNDDRITKLGAFLRRTSLDELPQFINVLQGKMSIVGPRPHAVAHNEEYRRIIDFYMLRHKVKPGITGWAQINGWRGETDTLEKMEKRIEFDIEYIRNWSLFFDVKIIFMTLFKGFVGKNAY
ncbi:undecaprenyl-phosphate glucose phosphotransferase [Agaribacterium haliotis]|uniref:undecaprenyl-phosphate glucose phosphotransferase n=1 Tax=Agaribacterium haliotis TaxID=2013869 RepID=UPI00195745E7|nr:undecaprenyl-phosphate glucose phosphotransferase [Agaribacterium haliotis]